MQKGDVIHVRFTVRDPDINSGTVVNQSDGTPLWVPSVDVVHIELRPLAIGDKVRARGYTGAEQFEIAAIVGEYAWCKSPNIPPQTRRLVDLVRSS